MTEYDTGNIWQGVTKHIVDSGIELRTSEMLIATRARGWAVLAHRLAIMPIKPVKKDTARDVRRNARRKGYRVHRDPDTNTWSILLRGAVKVSGLSLVDVDKEVRKLR